ncbi:hypothetical protein [Tenacibaculum finnmarkense]|uniref:hypothetical protein n=1 Tax=Tenacibaculum finnmarkense TaxID=2781243 RepID=UPI00187B9105|nr:hypothetical protein [Tenacibaculum finnmarkense]MBE7649168.1 hypothetical protein [Tenacibaculum finnmarkense genomovar ulcerans]MCD8435876.1 hypothetical protein [Tenacibaculum dicentrarchi]
MSKESEILEGLHYSILQDWISNGKVDDLPDGMPEYLNQLKAVSGWHSQAFSKTQIIKRLRATFQLNYAQAKNRYIDALNFFYLDNDIKFDAFMNIAAEQLDKVTSLILQTATNPQEAVLAIKSIVEAAKIRKEIKTKQVIPETFFQAPTEIYTIDLPELGVHEAINRNELARTIEAMENLEESEKIRIKQEAGIDLENSPRQLFIDAETIEEDE